MISLLKRWLQWRMMCQLKKLYRCGAFLTYLLLPFCPVFSPMLVLLMQFYVIFVFSFVGYLSTCQSVCLSFCLFVLYLSVCQSACFSFWLSVFIFVRLSVCLSICLFFLSAICLSVCLCVHMSMNLHILKTKCKRYCS